MIHVLKSILGLTVLLVIIVMGCSKKTLVLSPDAATEKLRILSESMKSGDIAEIHRMIKAGADINVKCENGLTPLHIASGKRYTDIVKMLLKEKANVNAVSTTGLTPLFLACLSGDSNGVKLLLEAGANVNVVAVYGLTPLEIASQKGYIDISKLLKEYGAQEAEISKKSPPTNDAKHREYLFSLFEPIIREWSPERPLTLEEQESERQQGLVPGISTRSVLRDTPFSEYIKSHPDGILPKGAEIVYKEDSYEVRLAAAAELISLYGNDDEVLKVLILSLNTNLRNYSDSLVMMLQPILKDRKDFVYSVVKNARANRSAPVPRGEDNDFLMRNIGKLFMPVK